MSRLKLFFANDKFLELDERNEESAEEYDIGIVVFEDHTFEDISPLNISNHKVVENTELVLVGYGIPTDVVNALCYDENIELVSYKQAAKANPKDRKYKEIEIPIGAFVIPWAGDSGGPALLYDKQNLVVGVGSVEKQLNNFIVACYTPFNSENVKWLKYINDTTAAIIPMDEIK